MDDPRPDQMTNLEFVYSIGMTEDEIEAQLRAESVGVLSLAADGDSYAIPVAYHYDTGKIFFRLGMSATSRKAVMLADTDTASFLVYDAKPLEDSWSIIATGPLSKVDESAGFSDKLVNAVFVPLRVFDEPVEDIDPTVFALEIESITGRRSAET